MGRPAPQDRHIRVFVSSTFRDMQAERDYLVKFTFPQLRKLCELRGVVWGEVDLRWGITDEEKAEGKVLPVCLEEIQRCRPYFIGLLGERYGWVPDDIPSELLERQPWLRDHRERSVTELEMVHGVLRREAMQGQAFFYFRDSGYLDRLPAGIIRSEFESDRPEAKAKLASLKQRLRQAQAEGICQVREPYADPKTLGDWMLEDFTELIDRLFPEGSQLDPLDRDALDHEAFAQSRAKVYIGREESFDRLDGHVTGEGPPLVVLGESGSGKSALLGNWFLRYQEAHPETLSILQFIGATPYSADWAAMLRRILGEFKRRFDIREEIPTDPNALRSTFANWLHRAAAKGKVVLVLDALNQLEDRDGAPDLVWLPPVVPANVRMILSTLPGRALENLTKREWPTLTVQPLKEGERKTLIAQYLAQYTKSLSPGRMTRIAAAPQTANPLYLRILLDELRLHGSHETLEPTIEHYLAAPSIPELYGKVLARWERDYEGNTDLVGDALSLLWAARRGLSETEWREVLGTDGRPLPQATFAPFLLAAESGLVSRSGLLTFAHDYLREAVRESYVPVAKHQQQAHRTLADYFATQPPTARHVDERPWQLAEAAEWRQLAQLLREEAFFVNAWQANEYEVRRLWAGVELHSSERMTEIYRSVGNTVRQEAGTTHAHNVAILLQTTGRLAESAAIYEVLQERARHEGDLAGLHLSLGEQALILRARGDLDGAMRLHWEEERLCRHLGDLKGLTASQANQAVTLMERGDLSRAMRLLREAERLYRELGDPKGLQVVLGNQAVIYQDQCDFDSAMRLFLEKERLCRGVGDLRGLATSLGNQGLIHLDRGNWELAIRLLKEQERISHEVGDPYGIGQSLGSQALVLKYQGDLDGALRLMKEQERVSRQLDDPNGLATSLGNQALIQRTRGNLAGAIALLQESVQLVRGSGNLKVLAFALGNLALSLQDGGALEKALGLHREVEGICRQLGNSDGLATSLGNQALILLARGDLDKAMKLLKEQERLYRELSNHRGLSDSFGNQAGIHDLLGETQEAKYLYQEQERVCRDLGDPNGLALSLANQARLFAQNGQWLEGRRLAEEAYRLALQHGLIARAQQIVPIVQQLGGRLE